MAAGLAVWVGVPVGVGVGVRVGVGLAVLVAVGVGLGVRVWVGLAVLVGVGLAVRVGVGLALRVGRGLVVSVGVALDVWPRVTLGCCGGAGDASAWSGPGRSVVTGAAGSRGAGVSLGDRLPGEPVGAAGPLDGAARS